LNASQAQLYCPVWKHAPSQLHKLFGQEPWMHVLAAVVAALDFVVDAAAFVDDAAAFVVDVLAFVVDDALPVSAPGWSFPLTQLYDDGG